MKLIKESLTHNRLNEGFDDFSEPASEWDLSGIYLLGTQVYAYKLEDGNEFSYLYMNNYYFCENVDDFNYFLEQEFNVNEIDRNFRRSLAKQKFPFWAYRAWRARVEFLDFEEACYKHESFLNHKYDNLDEGLIVKFEESGELMKGEVYMSTDGDGYRIADGSEKIVQITVLPRTGWDSREYFYELEENIRMWDAVGINVSYRN